MTRFAISTWLWRAFLITLLTFGLAGLPGCENEGPVEETAEEVDDAAEDAAEEAEEALEEVDDEVES